MGVFCGNDFGPKPLSVKVNQETLDRADRNDALARALTIGTRLLLLDEPFEGVAPVVSWRLAEVIGMLRGKDVSVLIAQSDLNHSVKLLDREYLIERGANRERPAPQVAAF